ncbi:hypothetical protein ACTPEM_25545, partial [Clostridioides difficile]
SYLPTFEKSNSRIDYIFVNKNTELKEYTVEKIYLSDHYPVIGDILPIKIHIKNLTIIIFFIY